MGVRPADVNDACVLSRDVIVPPQGQGRTPRWRRTASTRQLASELSTMSSLTSNRRTWVWTVRSLRASRLATSVRQPLRHEAERLVLAGRKHDVENDDIRGVLPYRIPEPVAVAQRGDDGLAGVADRPTRPSRISVWPRPGSPAWQLSSQQRALGAALDMVPAAHGGDPVRQPANPEPPRASAPVQGMSPSK